MAVSSVKHNKPVLPRTSDGSDLGSNRASIYSGKALSFDGVNDRVLLGTQSSINEEGFTISLYAKLDDDTEHYIFTTGYTTTNSILLFSPSSSNEVRLSWYDGSTAPNTGGITYVNGEWFHVTVTYDGSTIKIFKNGEEVISQSYAISAIDSGLYELGWATARNKSTAYLQGDLSDFKAFNTTLTPAQVKELYDNPEQAVPTGVDATSLVLHLPMTESAGSYLYNANAGAIGTELISNAGFDETCQKWGTTDSSTVEIAGGKAIWTNAPLSGSFVEQPLELEAGKFYRVSFDYTSTMFNIFVNLGNTQEAVPLGNGRYTYDMYYGTGNKSIKFQHGWTTNSSASVDNVSVKEVVPNYYNGTINGATWVSGLSEPLPQTALMDWNKYPFFDGTGDRYNSASTMKNFSTISGGGVSAYCRIIMGDKINNNQNFFSWGDNDGFRVRISDNNYFTVIQDGGANVLTSTTTFVSGQLYTVVAVVDSAGSRLYLDGSLIASNTTAFANPHSADNLTIGGYNSTSELLDGSVIDLKLWEYGLSNSDASALSGNQITPESITDYEIAHFDGANDFDDKLGNYSGIFGTKEYQFQYLIPKGSTAGKDVFGNTITNPRASGAYNFDGNSWAEIQDNASVDTVIPMTLEAWVYNNTGELSTSNRYMPIFDKATNSNGASGFTLRVYSTYSTNGGYLGVGGTYSAFNFTDGSYQHIVAVIEPSSQKIYINGSLQNSFTNSWTVSTNSSPLRIGYAPSDGQQWIYGQISSPRVYNYALTAQQVADNFNEKASTFGGTKVASELDAYIERTASDGATVEAHSCLVNYLTELDKK